MQDSDGDWQFADNVGRCGSLIVIPGLTLQAALGGVVTAPYHRRVLLPSVPLAAPPVVPPAVQSGRGGGCKGRAAKKGRKKAPRLNSDDGAAQVRRLQPLQLYGSIIPVLNSLSSKATGLLQSDCHCRYWHISRSAFI